MTRTVVLAVWVLVALSLAGCGALAWATRQGARRVAAAGEALAALSGARWSMVVCFVGWMWVGWHFFAR